MGDKRVEVKAAVPRGEMPARGPRGHAVSHASSFCMRCSWMGLALAVMEMKMTSIELCGLLCLLCLPPLQQPHHGHYGNGYARPPMGPGYGAPYGGYGGGYHGRGGFAAGPYGGAMPYGGYGGPEAGYPGGAMPPMAPPPTTNGGWSAHVAPDGTPYYYNERTGVSQWERPAELQG